MKKKDYFSVKEMAADVYGLFNCAVASFLIVGKEKALLFDTGYGVADIKEAVEKITKLPLYVVNSHGHVDHTSGNFHFPGPYYIHKADAEVYVKHNTPEFRNVGMNGVKKLARLLFWVNWIPKDTDMDAYLHAQAAENFVYIEEGYTFDLGGVTARVVELPGHTPGSIGLLVEEKGLLFVSDAINSNVWLFLPESQKLSVYQQTLKKVETLDFSYLVTGHSTALEPKTNLQKYIAVAMDPDIENAKPYEKSGFAPGVQPIRCVEKQKQGSKSKKLFRAGIIITEDKL